ncbi:MAG: hypothetical protein CO029_02725 [Candidatus Magasanikbacteria bacterium CG_4_9_14_0_2_um_filter_41_10]|uniref:Cation/H+ exchanger transmembrane domain-containing protein n=1 Tax=Candidatus Magasanikbacteria bacterium CG_4_10_14_0_2_um_filter_41_31 TaxID=1974639 RepID=A0A2M7V2X8_9BACT|nr:MAG: hypothetical protein AUJ37_03770 [Candidatus Magasanikbacteria bacterium CG1_02_41_34]PIZ92816.1 MAG: hypothetical protein COX83_03455 [Candidatus Magasanikbacteria bacterium CG_4_10_14_0_2_um_filter_41_31]PJC53448.1 MAG: hypothetical protein CO029_02725 [Candidatus Magasanikbacteria bacterium CG_4_9_14_0_2_um_filter_41_10]
MNLFFVFAIIFLITFVSGRYIERIRIPWIFAALLLGIVATLFGWHVPLQDQATFTFFAQLGMYLLLFFVGFEMNTTMLRKRKTYILTTTIAIISFEGILGTLLIHMMFSYSWLISALIAMSFATVGEAVLIPILDDYGIINSKLGQSIIAIGTMDDIVEVVLLVIASIVVGTLEPGHTFVVFGSLILLCVLATGLIVIKSERELFRFTKIETLFIFILFVFFLFIGIGNIADVAPLGAILAGVVVRIFLPPSRLKAIDSEVRTMTYGLFAPLFFFWVGTSLDLEYMASAPLLILAIVIVSSIAKLLASFIASRKELGGRGSVLLGVGLLVRFSTGIIIMKFFLDHGIIDTQVYSVIVASTIIFTIAVPILFAFLFSKWGKHVKA